ncbi:MAG: BlaI/MecI/CopY family transcriptional regulator [Planctomycetes bacterium]|nr:BlaI/MecI/CopY family transcriptional regulator [Planctomycetota bacterium]
MQKLPKIPESEWLVMRVLWSKGPLTANEVVKELTGKTKWKPKTIKTLITRLMKKGAVKFEKEGRKYRYYPAVSEAECVRMERYSFVRRVYGGTTRPMLAAFLEDAKLSAEDISELKKILEQKEGE